MPYLIGTLTREQEMNLIFEGGKSNKRAQRRDAEKRRTARLKRDLIGRTKGAFVDDNGELEHARLDALIYKRNDREQKGRLRLLKGAVSGAARRQQRDAEALTIS